MDLEVDDLLYGNLEEPALHDSIPAKEQIAPSVSVANTRQEMADTIQSLEVLPQKEQSQNRGRLLDPNLNKKGKMFIGGLSWETTDEGLRNYMKIYGDIEDVLIMKDSFTNRSRGFAFLTFTDPASIDKVLETEHYIDGKKVPLVINKKIDPKRAVPKDEYERAEKVFVGGVHADVNEREFKEYFEKFGSVTEATIVLDRNTKRPRGFGFVTFSSWDGVQKVLDAQAATGIFLLGKRMEVKPASLRHQPLGLTYPGLMASPMGMPVAGHGNGSPYHNYETGSDRGHPDDNRDSFNYENEQRAGDKHRDRKGRYDRDDDREPERLDHAGYERDGRRGDRYRERHTRYDIDENRQSRNRGYRRDQIEKRR